MIAGLPMYDWPHLQAANDTLWFSIRDELRRNGAEAPDHLTRPFAEADWMAADLTLAQTCGMPYRLWLHDHVTLVGTPDYGVPGCPPGYYRSVLVTRDGKAPGGRAAINSTSSQSGYAALLEFARPGADFLETGSHEASIRAVASGQADYAAIDAVSWEIAQTVMPAARQLSVFAQSEPRPGLPIIASRSADADLWFKAVDAGMKAAPAAVRDRLRIRSFVHIDAAVYLAVKTPLVAPEDAAKVT
jgi:ABC-type phosphate/phosphonate transport system substrate-binding protein